jgi:hypothetical protein
MRWKRKEKKGGRKGEVGKGRGLRGKRREES